ncbi:hypothetical protein KIPB_010106 [Kipferlia bialata]|uniref:Uncharacterized protein n=1 Tax=Kipferlia bialata TaxID=797122 RepID=A0A9K3GMK7_9EUKA|nr:hypothetical protein KIPB_010106 [Kipferlia bialata]|eukprot:g10106.t1
MQTRLVTVTDILTTSHGGKGMPMGGILHPAAPGKEEALIDPLGGSAYPTRDSLLLAAQRSVAQLAAGAMTRICAERDWEMDDILVAAWHAFDVHFSHGDGLSDNELELLDQVIGSGMGLDIRDLAFIAIHSGDDEPDHFDLGEVDEEALDAVFQDPFHTIQRLTQLCRRETQSQSASASASPSHEPLHQPC